MVLFVQMQVVFVGEFTYKQHKNVDENIRATRLEAVSVVAVWWWWAAQSAAEAEYRLHTEQLAR